jgi:hypothetical protein
MCSPIVCGGSSKMLGRRYVRRTRTCGRKATDEWGYTFRLGSTRAWFENDAEDALAFLLGRGLVEHDDRARDASYSLSCPKPA